MGLLGYWWLGIILIVVVMALRAPPNGNSVAAASNSIYATLCSPSANDTVQCTWNGSYILTSGSIAVYMHSPAYTIQGTFVADVFKRKLKEAFENATFSACTSGYVCVDQLSLNEAQQAEICNCPSKGTGYEMGVLSSLGLNRTLQVCGTLPLCKTSQPAGVRYLFKSYALPVDINVVHKVGTCYLTLEGEDRKHNYVAMDYVTQGTGSSIACAVPSSKASVFYRLTAATIRYDATVPFAPPIPIANQLYTPKNMSIIEKGIQEVQNILYSIADAVGLY